MLNAQPRVLLVEDEIAIADTLLYALRTEGFAAEHESLGRTALARHRESPFDLIVLDLGLPDIGGFDVLRGIRSGAAPTVPVMFLTARAEEIDRVLGLELGADDYVVKPFSPREVVARVRAILRRGRLVDGGERRQTDGRWRRHAEAMRIEYHGVALDLTRYEYRLLDLLLAHPDRVFSREQIMGQVWEDALDTADRTVDAHVKTLRAKLKAVRPDENPIQTHRGIGYSLTP